MSENDWIFIFSGVCALESAVSLFCLSMGVKKRSEVTTESDNPKGPLPKRWVFGTALGILLSLALSAYGFYRSLNCVPAFDDTPPLKHVNDQVFVNTEVQVDGCDFKRCRFQNVTLFYKGEKMFSMVHCGFVAPIVLKTRNKAFTGLMGLEKALGWFPKDLQDLGHGLDEVEVIRPPTQLSPTPDTEASPP
jgi:hypothetical protein